MIGNGGNTLQIHFTETLNGCRKFVSELVEIQPQWYLQDKNRWPPYIIKTVVAVVKPRLRKQLLTRMPNSIQDRLDFAYEMEDFVLKQIPETLKVYEQQLLIPEFIEASDDDDNLPFPLGQSIANNTNPPANHNAAGPISSRHPVELGGSKGTQSEGPTAESSTEAKRVNQSTRIDLEAPKAPKQEKRSGNPENTGLGPPSGPPTSQ